MRFVHDDPLGKDSGISTFTLLDSTNENGLRAHSVLSLQGRKE
jgi:hypothetical protein